MGKKRSRTTKHSKGIHSTYSPSLIKAVRRERYYGDHMMNLLAAWKRGKNPWVTIANPIADQTNKRNIRVKANGLWGDPKKATYDIYRMKSNY